MNSPALIGGDARRALKRLLALETLRAAGGAAGSGLDLLPAEECWDAALRGLEAHGLAPWAHEALATSGLGGAVPPWVAARLRDHVRATALRNRLLLRSLDELAGACAAAGVELIPFKGAALARRLYRDPGLRPMGDLDLLVRPGAVGAADRVLRRSGYSVPPHVDVAATRREHFHCVYNRPANGVTVELHWDFGGASLLTPAAVAALWERSVAGTTSGLRSLDAATELVAVAVHAWKHGFLNPALVGDRRLLPALLEPLSGNRLIWLLDLHRLMRRGDAEADVCRARALEWDAAAALQGAAALAAEAFGPVPGWGFADAPRRSDASWARLVVARHLARKLAAGSIGTARLLERLSRMDPDLQARPIRALELLDRFRAPALLDKLRARLGPVILPACWIGAALAGTAALSRAAAMAIRSRVRRRRTHRSAP